MSLPVSAAHDPMPETVKDRTADAGAPGVPAGLSRPPPGLLPDAAALALRAVHRAASELRRGTPVLLRHAAGAEALLLAAAETVGARGLAEIAALAGAPPLLLLAPARAAALEGPGKPPAGLRRLQDGPPRRVQEEPPVALALPPALLDPATLRGFADPTAERLLPGPIFLKV